MAKNTPLAERLRPHTLSEFVGQKHLLDEGRFLNTLIQSKSALPSLILWGPPGCGKTTLARLLAKEFDLELIALNAVSDGVKELRQVFDQSKHSLRPILLFVDEIHRFKSSQQDALLGAVEAGHVIFVGATTENPSFYINRALVSRLRVLQLKALEEADFEEIIMRALTDNELGLGKYFVAIGDQVKKSLISTAGGDARSLLNVLEQAVIRSAQRGDKILQQEDIDEAQQYTTSHYDRSGDNHYDFVSALHKSIRNSNPDAALYYLARMLDGGEDPLFIIRRLIRAAAEDIGLADPQALSFAVTAKEAVEHLGVPECDVILAQVTIYLATAPKSNSVYEAMSAAKKLAKNFPALPVPMHLRNAVTELMTNVGYGSGYSYDHTWPEKVSPMDSMPTELKGVKLYHPSEWAFEKEVKKRIEFFEKARLRARNKNSEKDGLL
ncbi:MAG: replication-associated recombination protein A [Bdellovibrionota bacterium]